MTTVDRARRNLLHFLAASPLLAAMPMARLLADQGSIAGPTTGGGADSLLALIKGIVTAEDAAAAVAAGVDAVYVSNHGGRAEASGWVALDSLPEVVSAVDGADGRCDDCRYRPRAHWTASMICKKLLLGQ